MDFVEQLKSSVDLVSLSGESIQLRRDGANRYVGPCPFHPENSPSFYKCSSCRAAGDVIKFVMDIERIGFQEALRFLGKRNDRGPHGLRRTTQVERGSREPLRRVHPTAALRRQSLHGALPISSGEFAVVLQVLFPAGQRAM